MNGKLPGDGSADASATPNEEIFRAIVSRNNARLAQSFVLRNKADPLLSLRAHVYRGELAAAAELSRKMLEQMPDKSLKAAGDGLRACEVLLEQARVLAMSGRWPECESICGRALESTEISPVSQLTLFQIRALALYETHRMTESLADLDRIDALAEIFPNSPSAFYGAVIRARIVAWDRGMKAGFSETDLLWRKLLDGANANIDRVHALLRTELDLRRIGGENPATGNLLVSYRIAELTGERLYQALGALEAGFAGNAALTARFAPIARDLAKEFEKVGKLLEDVERGDERGFFSLTGSLLARASRSSWRAPRDEEMARSVSALQAIFIARHDAVIHLKPFRAVGLEDKPQLRKALLALRQGAAPMKEFFASIWGRQRYSPELHAHLISSLLYRLKKSTGVHARANGGSVVLENAWVLD